MSNKPIKTAEDAAKEYCKKYRYRYPGYTSIAFEAGFNYSSQQTAELQREVERLRNGLKQIEQMSDCGDYWTSICRMKSIATDTLEDK